jgi:large subunit ribosomal protein L13
MLKSQKTTIVKNQSVIRAWHEIDAAQYTLGRLASHVAHLLRGKQKTSYAPHQDVGDFVVVTNASKVKFSGRSKATDKRYFRYSGYPGGLRSETLAEKLTKDPEKVIRGSVRGMLDDNRLRKLFLRRLKVVDGQSHEFPTAK